jgi:hypothetical protein
MAIKKEILDLDSLIARVKYTEMSASLRAELLEALDEFRTVRNNQALNSAAVPVQEANVRSSRR